MSRLLLLASLALWPLASGCAPVLAGAIAAAPNGGSILPPDNPLPSVESLALADRTLRVPVGPPAASLAVSIVEPEPSAAIEGGRPRGTIVVAHGIGYRSYWMQGIARRLSAEGYRAVLVDLRGHGRSTGDWMSFGVHESRDLSQVLDELDARGLLAHPVGAYGISYGASTVLQFAGRDPRVHAVVAVSPFANLRSVLPQYARTILPGVGRTISDETLQEAIDEAGRRGGFDPDDANAAAAVQSTRASILLLHGASDWLVPPEHSQRIHAAAPDHSELILVPDTGHVAMYFDLRGQIAQTAVEFFRHQLR
ncbi:MAG: alpha/beta fold hydrolase [Planctomycetia bacterium]|nr:alpha/beta fold hydrolase [Planctomycetia bacterium]